MGWGVSVTGEAGCSRGEPSQLAGAAVQQQQAWLYDILFILPVKLHYIRIRLYLADAVPTPCG